METADIEKRLVDTAVGEEGESGMDGESNMEPNTLPSVKQIVNGNLLSDPGNSNWGSVTTLERWDGTGGGKEVQESGDRGISMVDSHWFMT